MIYIIADKNVDFKFIRWRIKLIRFKALYAFK